MFKSKVLRGSLILTLSSVISKLIFFLVVITYSRQVGPASFGLYTSVLSILVLLGLVTKMGTDTVMIIESNQGKSVGELYSTLDAFRWRLTIFTAMCFVIYIAFVGSNVVYQLLFSILIFVGGPTGAGWIEQLNSFYKSRQNYTPIFIADFIRSSTMLMSVFILNQLDAVGDMSFLIVLLGSSILSLVYLLQKTGKEIDIWAFVSSPFRWSSSYSKGISLGVVSLTYEVSNRVGLILGARIIGDVALGIYSASYQLYFIGVILMANFSVALLPTMASNVQSPEFRRRSFRAFFVATLGIVAILAVVTPFVPTIFDWIYGEKYRSGHSDLLILIWILPLRLLSLWFHQIIESLQYFNLRIPVFLVSMIVNLALLYFWETPLIMSKSLLVSNIVLFLGILFLYAYVYFNKKSRLWSDFSSGQNNRLPITEKGKSRSSIV